MRSPQDAGNNAYDRDGLRPAMPARADFSMSVAGSSYRPLTPFGDDPTPMPRRRSTTSIGSTVIGTDPQFNEPNPTLDPYFEGWQAPGQWLLDPYGRIHRVAQGRRNKRQGPVRLDASDPAAGAELRDLEPGDRGGGPYPTRMIQTATDEVRSLWFVPPVDRRGISLTPVYVTVRDL